MKHDELANDAGDMMQGIERDPSSVAVQQAGIRTLPGVGAPPGVVDVSVIAANYNNGTYLREFFDSCVASSVTPLEWIFVDDGSTDDSLAIARSYASKLLNLRIICLPTNRGFAGALNEGVRLARGRFIARVDPDDILMPRRLASQYVLLSTDSVDVVGCNASYYQSGTKHNIGRTNFPVDHTDIVQRFKNGELGVLHATVMAKSTLFRAYPYVQARVPAEDYDVFARMAKAGARFVNLSEPGIRYRVHLNSVSNGIRYSTIATTFRLRYEIFGTHTSLLRKWLYFVYIASYRRGLFSKDWISRSLYFGIAVLAKPGKAVARLRAHRPAA